MKESQTIEQVADPNKFLRDEGHGYVDKPRGHVWETDEEDAINFFAHCSNGGRCNGPKCTKCGYEFCHHCEPEAPDHDCE